MAGGRIGFIGLGVMGEGMSANLVRAGFAVAGYDVEQAAVERCRAKGVAPAGSPRAAAEGADLLCVCVFTAAQASDVLFGERGAVAALPKGAVVINHTTVSPEQAKALAARLAETGHGYVDAPVTGGKSGADEGTLTVIAAGAEGDLAKARPALEAMGKRIYDCGRTPGQGSAVKMINQMMVGIHVAATAEGMALAARAGVDPKLVFDVITHGVGNSTVFQSRVPTILSGDYTPRGFVGIFTKDLGIVLDAGRDLSFPLPVTAAVYQQFLAAAAAGHARKDDAAVVKVYEAIAGIDVKAAADKAG